MQSDSTNGGGHPGGHSGGHSGGHPGGHSGGHSGGHGGGHPGGGPVAGHPGVETGVPTDVFTRQYAQGTAPWDIGRPQPEIVALEDAATFGTVVLDVGCGTGENAIFLASREHEVHGIDSAPQAVERAREKAIERGVQVDFMVGDVLEILSALNFTVDAVTDVGFFHVLDDEERPRFAAGLAHALEPGGVYAMLCFSDRVPGAYGPRRVSEAEIRSTFAGPEFRVRDVRPGELLTAVPRTPVLDANLAIVERV